MKIVSMNLNQFLYDDEQSKSDIQHDYLDDNNNNDCLTNAFLTIYKSSIWCLQSIYELIFKSLWPLTKEEIRHKGISRRLDVMSINNSAGKNYPSIMNEKLSRELPRRHQLSKSSSQYLRQDTSSRINMISNKTRVTVRSMSNQNINRAESNHTSIKQEKKISNTLGSINSHIVVVPVPVSQCQNMTSNNDLAMNHGNLKRIENMNSREQLTDALCRRFYEPMNFMNRGMCCGHRRPLFFPNVPFHHAGPHFPSPVPEQQSNQERELPQQSKQSPSMGDASETVSTAYSVSPSIQSHITNSIEDEPLSNDAIFHNETNEANQSILSFPDHDTPLSQQSDQLNDDDGSQLKLDAQILVDDLIQNAQEKYQRIVRMSIDQDPLNSTSDTVKQSGKNKLKSVLISDESNRDKTSNENTLCQQLCSKLNLSDPNQITEILRILASNAPHILKQESSNPIKENENTACNQLLLHPPFKPKRLIHLCPDGTIQVLSAIDENSNDNQQKYRLNYSNSAITPSIQRNNILTNESSLELEYETTTIKTNLNHMMFSESKSTQQKKTLFKYNNTCKLSSKHSLTQEINDDPIVNINLDLNDETMSIHSEDDENSLPEIFFKRIIAPKNSTNEIIMNEKDETVNIRRKNHQKSRYNRSRSHTNKQGMNIER